MSRSSSQINFGLRPSKAIERGVAFDGLRRAGGILPLQKGVYVGLGSAWFVDFDHAHRDLGIATMISIESDEIVHARAVFNRPFRTVEVIEGASYDEVPKLLERAELGDRSWTVWLDYDEELDDTKLDELRRLPSTLPANSALLATFNAHPGSYGAGGVDRFEVLSNLLGDAFPSEQFPEGRGLGNPEKFQKMLADSVLQTLRSSTIDAAREGGFVPAFDLQYQDGAPMVTVGGFFPTPEHHASVTELVSSTEWRCMPTQPIKAPPLTLKEISAIRTLLPAQTAPTRNDIQELGFDLAEDQLESFVRYYLEYPMFIQASR